MYIYQSKVIMHIMHEINMFKHCCYCFKLNLSTFDPQLAEELLNRNTALPA